jgi:DUF4097 and DUF4098 domain-containing protein YvlB
MAPHTLEEAMDKHVERAFDTTEPVALHVELGGGTLHAEAVETDRSTVEVTGPRADEFSIELRGRALAVVAPKGGGLFRGGEQHQVRVVVPTRSDLSTKTGSADTEATGTWSAVRAKTGSGDVEVEDAESHVVVDSGSGDIRCDRVADNLRVRTGSGDVEVGEVRGTTAISTGSGDVALGATLASAVLKTGSGDLQVHRSCDDLTMVSGSGRLDVRQATRGSIRARTGSGDVHVGVPEGTPVWTDISASSGRVVSDLRPVGKPADGQDHVQLRLRTGSGDVVLSQVPHQS